MSRIRPNAKGDGLLIPNSTQIPNVLLDRLMPVCSPAVWKVVCCVARQTYGWKKEWDAISISTLMDKTGLSNRKVIDTMDLLTDATITIRGDLTEWGYRYCLNEEPDFEKALDMLRQAERPAREKPSGGRIKDGQRDEPGSLVAMNSDHNPCEPNADAASSWAPVNPVHGEPVNPVQTQKPTSNKPTIQTKGESAPPKRDPKQENLDTMDRKKLIEWIEVFAPQTGTYIANRDAELFQRIKKAAERCGLSYTRAKHLLRAYDSYRIWPWIEHLDSQQEIDFGKTEATA